MIPKQIDRSHILSAIKELSTEQSLKIKKFYVDYKGKKYPPKQLISLANKYSTGKVLDPKHFRGGNQTNNFLIRLFFRYTNNVNS